MKSNLVLALILAVSALLAPAASPNAAAAPAGQPLAATKYTLRFSASANRSSSMALQGKQVSGNIYVFVSPESGARQVRFYVDNTAAAGAPTQTEGNAPWDFAGGTTSAANPYDTSKLSNAWHTLTAVIDYANGGSTKISSSFLVSNKAAAATPTRPPATATPAPTATRPPSTATAAPTGAPTSPPTPQPTAAPTVTPAPVSGAIYWGVNMEAVPWDLNKLSAWERDVAGKAVSIINWGHFWDNGSGGYRNWSNGTINNARGHGSIPMISWTPEGGDNSRWQLGDIIRGDHDAYIRQFATDAKTWGHPFFLRIMHEMNGSWGYPWQETQNGNQRGEFVQAWRRIVDIFNSVGAGNASFVWCPNIDYPNTTNPSFASLYPGDAYVDWTCLDGYNWGTSRSSGWQSFDQVYNYSYNEILKFAPAKPMMIGEFGSVEQGAPAGQSKATWFTDTLATQLPARYPRVRAAVYFNWPFDGVDWRIETSAAAQDAWRAGITSPYYLANQFGATGGGKVAVP
jgi:hypothetical protein